MPHSRERGLILCKLSTLCRTGPTRAPARPQCPADYTQCRVRNQSSGCESEKRLVKSQWSGVAITERGALGALTVHALPPLRPKDRFGLTRLYLPYFSNRSPPWDCFNSCGISAQFLSTYQSVHLHNSFAFMGKRIDYYFRAMLEWNRINLDRFLFASTIAHERHLSLFLAIHRRASAYC